MFNAKISGGSMKDTNLRLRDAEIEISKLAKSTKTATQTIENMQGVLHNQQTALNTQETTLQTHQSALESLENTTTQHASSISILRGGNDVLTNRVNAVENSITAQQASIEENAKSIAENSANITQNTQSLEAHAETLVDQDTSIKILSNTSSNLIQRVAYLEETATESSVVLEPRLAEVERKQAEAQIEINALNKVIGETQNTVEDVQTQVSQNAEAIEELKANGADVTALEQQIAQNATNIEALQTKVNTLQGAVQINATNIAENSTKISGIQENYRVVANALNRITELEKLHGLAKEVWGGRGTSVEEITELLDDYATESNFCTETTAHLQFGTQGDAGPHARIFFRQNPIRTTNPTVVLKFDFSNLPSDLDALPCNITFNGLQLFSGSLTLDASAEFQAVATLPIDTAVHNIVMFNELFVQFNDTALTNTILDFVQVEITNSQNCIVLNRGNHINIYGWVNTETRRKRLVCSRYYKGQGFKTFMSTEQTHLMNLESSATAFPATSVGDYPVVWASRYLQENFNLNNNGIFTLTTGYQLDYYINSNNQLFVNYNKNAPSVLKPTYYHVDNVLYAKKSLHNGLQDELEDALVVHTDFSIAKYYAHYYTTAPSNFLLKSTFKLSSKEYPNEFVDFVPVHDYTVGATKTTKHNIGYFLLHKSSNIFFVPESSSKYFIKIGKGSQITASYHTDFMGIDVFFNCGNVVYKKVLRREEFNSTEWTLSDEVEIIEDADYVLDNDYYQFKIKSGEVTQIIK